MPRVPGSGATAESTMPTLEYHTVKIGGQPGGPKYDEAGLPCWFEQTQIAKPALIKDDLAKLGAGNWKFGGTMYDGTIACAVFWREKVA